MSTNDSLGPNHGACHTPRGQRLGNFFPMLTPRRFGAYSALNLVASRDIRY